MMELLVNIDVGNLDEAIRFYERAVGLRLGHRLFKGTVAEVLGAASPAQQETRDAGHRKNLLSGLMGGFVAP